MKYAGINCFLDLGGADVAVRSFAMSLALEGSLQIRNAPGTIGRHY